MGRYDNSAGIVTNVNFHDERSYAAMVMHAEQNKIEAAGPGSRRRWQHW